DLDLWHSEAPPPTGSPRLRRSRSRSEARGEQEPRWRACGGQHGWVEAQEPPPTQSQESLRTDKGERRRRPGSMRPESYRPTPPTSRMVAFAERLAKDKRATLPSGYDKDFDICRRFLDQHAGR